MAFLDNPLLSLGNYMSQAGQGFDNALGQASNPFGLAPPPGMSAEQAGRMPYLDLGAGILANSTQRPLQAAAKSFRDMREQGMDMGTKRLWAQQVQGQLQDSQEERENKKKMIAQLQALLQGGGGQGGQTQPPLPNQAGATPDTPPTFQEGQGSEGMQFSPSQRFQAQYFLGAGNPDKAMSALFAKSGTPMQTREVNGKIYSFDPDTGQLGQELGAASTKQQTIPASVQTDVIKAKQAYQTLDKELGDYERLIAGDPLTGAEGSGYTLMPGQETDRVAQSRRNIQLQLKELYNLGVINGPDLSLMDQMLYDPSALNASNWTNIVGNFFGQGDDPATRAKASAGNLRQMMKTIVDNKIGQANAAGGSYAPMQDNQMAPAPDGVDPEVWKHMTPEEQAEWN